MVSTLEPLWRGNSCDRNRITSQRHGGKAFVAGGWRRWVLQKNAFRHDYPWKIMLGCTQHCHWLARCSGRITNDLKTSHVCANCSIRNTFFFYSCPTLIPLRTSDFSRPNFQILTLADLNDLEILFTERAKIWIHIYASAICSSGEWIIQLNLLNH